ncbi:Hypothetical_protein [Hexamita inflata]|uniref:Hypothetical_protein n=1 Tax=Hexamita inflata TaxID=28002 RepID=A0AA86PHR1_9EUKA|nr:Hypothetical protein HINF_LOCUS25073 [Hexamita inflata]
MRLNYLKRDAFTYFIGDIIPIVVSPQLQMYPKTIEQMKKYCDMQKLYKDIAYNVIKMEVEKSRMYEEEVKNYLELQHLNIQSKLKVQPYQSLEKQNPRRRNLEQHNTPKKKIFQQSLARKLAKII